MSNLSTTQQGDASKPALVLVHGWGAHSGVWQSVLPNLLEKFNITCIDLPGHGQSGLVVDNSIDGWAEAALKVAPQRAIWLGWSLGGLLAQYVASIAQQRVEKLIILASTPKFITADDWHDAVDEKTFRDFHTQVIRDPHASLLRFIALQTRGSETASQDSRVLRKTLLQPEPEAEALDIGMQLLLETDLRNKLPDITTSTLLLTGERDTLIPASLPSTLNKLISNLESVAIKQAGHAPFLSHPEQFCQALADFCFKDNAIQPKEAK